MRTNDAFLFALPVLLLFAAAGPALSAASVYEIRPGGEGNLVLFRSKAPLETIEGTTRSVSGRIEADLESLGDSATFVVEVDLASIDTGIDLRNRHMRENHLHTDRFPAAIFRGGSIRGAPPAAIPPGGKASFTLAGEFTLHGVTRPLVVPIEIARSRSDSLTIQASFDVLLSDFQIPRPEFLVMRLDEKQRLEIRLAATPAAAAPAAAPAGTEEVR